MASTRMMTTASAEYYEAIQAARDATGKEREELRATVAKIGTWLESATLGHSDRDCAFHSGYEPAPRRLRRASRELVEVGT